MFQMHKAFSNTNTSSDSGPPTCLIASALLTVAEALGHFLSVGNDFSVSYAVDREGLETALRQEDAPALALIDYDLPGLSGLPGTLDILRRSTGTRVVVITDTPLRYTAARLMGAGATGVVTRTMSAAQLKAALGLVIAGEAFVPRDVLPKLVKAGSLRDGPPLSDLELSVLRHLCEGRSNAQIGRLLALPELTVQSMVRTLCGRLNVANRTQAALAAVTAGLV